MGRETPSTAGVGPLLASARCVRAGQTARAGRELAEAVTAAGVVAPPSRLATSAREHRACPPLDRLLARAG